jgi:hypothetical protein
MTTMIPPEPDPIKTKRDIKDGLCQAMRNLDLCEGIRECSGCPCYVGRRS